MTTTQRRFALLSGASLSALGVSVLTATPALAAPHNQVIDGIYGGTDTTSDIIPICAIADDPADCFFGEKLTGSGTVGVVVASTTEGQIYQHHNGTTELVIANIATEGSTNNSAEVGAIAISTGNLAGGNAYATLNSAVHQSAHSGFQEAAVLSNTGNFLIDAHAYATGATGATAAANLGNYGLLQQVGSAGYATAMVSNEGNLTIAAYATAIASEGVANANAGMTSNGLPIPAAIVQTGQFVGNGVRGDAYGTLALNVVNGAGNNLNIGVTAIASGDTANANANLPAGIVQFGFAADQMNFGVTNDGTLDISANAYASGAAGNANANANIGAGIVEIGFNAFTAAEHVTNSGAMNIGAHATANAYDTAAANAHVGFGIVQVAFADDAAADVYNTAAGVLSITASANANGGAEAHANAAIGNTEGFGTGIGQLAGGTTNAHAGVVNDGLLAISAVAHANGYSSASANAFAKGIGQAANINNNPSAIPATASDTITNSGTLNVHATAVAAASSGVAAADATVGFGVSQNASGFDASADITNNGGTIDIGAVASATGTAVGVQNLTAGGWGEGNLFVTGGANAHVNAGLIQDVSAQGTYTTGGRVPVTLVGDANANITNTGTVNIHANAYATANDAGLAIANGGIEIGVGQDVDANGGDASATIDNAGTLNITAVASAHAATGTAAGLAGSAWWGSTHAVPGANAFVEQGINQDVGAHVRVTGTDTHGPGATAYNTAAQAGNALASLTNGGTINIEAVANATAYNTAFAAAYVGGGIHQFATAGDVTLGYGTGASSFGGNATAYMSNAADGVINVVANAHASGATNGGTAMASATVSDGIVQTAVADAGNSLASLANDGAINIHAIAYATGDAHAFASVDGGIAQYAGTFAEGEINVLAVQATAGGPYSTAIIVNNGTIDIGATAVAHATGTLGDPATATANVVDAIQQVAHATDGNALVSLTGTGTINIGAVASAVADSGAASANAHIYGNGVSQSASAEGGTASAVLSQAAIDIHATAYASGLTGASAQATINGGIAQYASAHGTGTQVANVSLVNDGAISVVAAATAVAPGATLVSNGDFSSTAVVFPHATAEANIGTGIYQQANAFEQTEGVAVVGAPGLYGTVTTTYTYSGVANASVAIDNTGSITIGAGALASGADAVANANVGTGIYQQAHAEGGSSAYASASLANAAAGSIVVGAVASAYGSSEGMAHATVGIGITQKATAAAEYGTAVANVSLTNAGSISVGASALASAGGPGIFGNATDGNASAVAHVGTGIYQDADASGFGLATRVSLIPTTEGGVTTSNTFLGAGSANAVLNNTGSIMVTANASANSGGEANATADIDKGIEQDAVASGATAADAHASITNSAYGTMAVLANATASGSSANAAARVGTGISQNATATATAGKIENGPANATVNLSNAGVIAIGAVAYATGGTARATGSVTGIGIYQHASASGTAGAASAYLTNTGNITIAGSAFANASEGSATANAGVDTGIWQSASGVDSALASLSNAAYATIAISAKASASGQGGGFAYANIDTGLSQDATSTAVGGYATAELTNNGAISIVANANAFGGRDGSAVASATIGTGVYQHARAYSSAAVSLVNNGSLNILAAASASGDEDATATAGIRTGVYQYAAASGDGGNASASFANNGVFNVAAAANALGGGDVYADAYARAASQYAFGGSEGSANVSFDNNAPLNVSAYATALGGGDGTASAFATGIYQQAGAGGSATASVYNTNAIAVTASANVTVGNAAHRGSYALATAAALGVSQSAAGGTTSDTTFGTRVFTDAFGVNAYVSQHLTDVAFTRTVDGGTAPTGSALVTLTNTGTIEVNANASAVGEPGALAYANATAVNQHAAGTSAVASVLNYGTIAAHASALASGQNGASATAHAAGVHQTAIAAGTNFHTVYYGTGTLHRTIHATEGVAGFAYGTTVVDALTTAATRTQTNAPAGPALATLTNTGMINVGAYATAFNVQGGPAIGGTDTTPAFASAGALGVGQVAGGTEATLVVDNSGTIDVAANAYASGATAATAVANAQGIVQGGTALRTHTTGYATLGYATNMGNGTAPEGVPLGHRYQTLLWTSATDVTGVGAVYETVTNSGAVTVNAAATAVAGSSAYASATATGIRQVAAGSSSFQNVYNTGTIGAFASANASGTAAYAAAYATGVAQSAAATNAYMSMFNGGTITANAVANASGTYGTAAASAVGYRGSVTGGGTLNANIVNYGTMNVSATAIAPETASAHAVGIWLANAPTGGAGNALNGYVTNSGALNVVASASGGSASYATATGIRTNSGINNLTITNSGTINVDAVVANGGTPTAYGIRATGNGTTTPAAGDVLTINNSGDIIVRVSSDGGTTFQRGEAIDVSDAPNRSVINLMGNGTAAANIYGNIELRNDADTINVTNGETRFNGVVNSGCMPAGGPTALHLDVAAQNDCGVGTLNINTGGNLHLLNVAADGPSYVFMNTLNMGAAGTITFELPPADGTVPIGTYPQVYVDTANLGGTIVANIAAPGNGLFDSTIYENVIDAVTRNGQFANCVINGLPTGSLLLSATCIYDNLANVDIGVVRAPFESPSGLNQNGTSVATGLDSYFDVNLTGGAARMFADLFLISSNANYNTALNMLSGSSYANYLQSFPSLGVHYNDLLDHATNCEVPALAGSVLECRASAPIHVWGQLDYQQRKADGDIEAGTTKSKRFTGLLGVDANVGNAAILGVSAGYVSNHTRDHQFGDSVNADGMQVGAYAVYDPGPFYVKGVTTYSWYDGDSSRHINFTGLATGASFVANPSGDPDIAMWTAGLHGGARLPMGGNSVITPYLNYDYVDAKLKSFSETGGNGAELTVDNNHSRHSFLTGGVKWATQMGGVVPEVNLGYRYRFGNSRSRVHEWFTPDPENDFNIISASQKRGSFLAGVSVGGKLGPVDVRIGYEGEFNGDVTSHSGNFKFVLPLGGHAAPPPPPPVVAPPPPPPVEVAPPPPPPAPPPPPPVERGERGQ